MLLFVKTYTTSLQALDKASPIMAKSSSPSKVNGESPMPTDGPLNADAGPSLAALADSLSGSAHLLSLGDEQVAQLALDAAKSIFDYGTYLVLPRTSSIRLLNTDV